MSLKVKIKAKGDDAEEILEGHLPGASNDSRKPDVGTPAGSAPDGAEEYYGQTDLGGHSKSYDESGQMSKEVRESFPGGVHRTQEVGPQGNSGGGQSIEVKTATVDNEKAKKCANTQVGSNRQYFNDHERRRNS